MIDFTAPKNITECEKLFWGYFVFRPKIPINHPICMSTATNAIDVYIYGDRYVRVVRDFERMKQKIEHGFNDGKYLEAGIQLGF